MKRIQKLNETAYSQLCYKVPSGSLVIDVQTYRRAELAETLFDGLKMTEAFWKQSVHLYLTETVVMNGVCDDYGEGKGEELVKLLFEMNMMFEALYCII